MNKQNQTESIFVILNPKAGSQQAAKKQAFIESCLNQYFKTWKLETTKGPKHAISLAQKASDEGYNIIAIVGGDGSCHEAVQGIMNSEKNPVFAIIPFGTGGDLRKSTGTPKDLRKAIQVAAFGTDKLINIGFIKRQGSQGPEDEYFINVAGFGANGEVAERSNRWSKRLGGKLTFLNATLYTSLTYRAPTAHLEWINVDGTTEEWTGKLLSCFIGNAQYCGGGMKVAPDDALLDNSLHLRLLPELSVAAQVYHMPKLYDDKISQVEGSICREIKEIKAFATQKQDIQIDLDGELSGKLPAHFSIVPKALTIRGVWKSSQIS